MQNKSNYFLALILLLFSSQLATGQEADEIAREMFRKTKEIQTLTYEMSKEERIDGELQKQVSFTKLSRKPFKVYTKQLSPNEGIEVLFHKGDDTALVNPNGFPWFNLYLNPLGSRMTKNQHHTILDAGFDTFINILEHLFNKYDEEIDEMAEVTSVVDQNNRPCWKLAFNNPYYKINSYRVNEGESVIDIANRKYLSEYRILQLNPEIDDLKDVQPGEVIKIPNDYAQEMVLLIDKELYVPTKVIVYDDEGIFEKYEFSDIKIDPAFAENEFSPDFEGYDF